MKKALFKDHTAIDGAVGSKVAAYVAELRKWRYERASSAVTNNVNREGYDSMTPMLDEEQEKILADTTILIELKDAISETYREHTARWENLRAQVLAMQCNEQDWDVINTQIQAIINERKFLDTLFINGNGVQGSSWYRKTGWNITTSSALKNRLGIITCPVVLSGNQSGVSIVSWRVRFIDMGRMFMTPFFGKGISAQIPDNIGDLEYLEELSFCFNFLMGEIPDSICNLKNLRILKLEANQLSGTLPVGFGASMKSLQELYLDHNRFEGSIDELLDLPAATTIHVHENKFFGELKDDFLDKGLSEFYFYRNYLEYSDRIANRCDGKYWKGRTEKESPMRVIKL